MRCREVRRKLNEIAEHNLKQEIDPQLTAHLRRCPTCARDAHLNELLAVLTAFAGENDRSRMMPLARMREAVEQRTAHISRVEAETTVADGPRVRHVGWKSVAWAGAVAIIVIFFGLQFVLSPGPENHIIGYEVAFAGVQRELAEDTESICYLLWTLELPEADIDEVICDSTCRLHIVYLQSPEEAARVIEAFSQMENAYRTAEIIPVRAQGTPNPSS